MNRGGGAYSELTSEAPSGSDQPSTEKSPEPEREGVAGAASGAFGTLAGAIIDAGRNRVSADVVLDGAGPASAVVGSFTADGLTFAVTEGSNVELVGVSPDWHQAADPQEGERLSEAAMPASQPVADGSSAALALPETVSYGGIDYAVTSVGTYALYLSGVTEVELPASVGSIDERAFRSSDVAAVTVAEENPFYASFDGALYSADMTSLLLIPEGRTGAVRVPSHAASVEASAFSHCAGVDAIAVDADCSHLSSEDGLLYNADGTVLLRVPAGATEATVREGCTAIAAGALEGCAKLERVYAPASVASISPDVFTSVPTVSLPAVSVAADDTADASRAAAAEAPGSTTTQLTAMVALSSADDDLPEVDPAGITAIQDEGDGELWSSMGFHVASADALPGVASLDTAATYAAGVRLWIWGTSNRYHYRVDDTPFQNTNYFTNGDRGIGHMTSIRLYSGRVECRLEADSMLRRFSVNATTGAGVTSAVLRSRETGDVVLTVTSSWQNVPEEGTDTDTGWDLCMNGVLGYARKVTWEPEGGTLETAYTGVAAGSRATSPVPTRAGYECLGWYTSPSGGTKVCDAGGQTGAISDFITYYAQWERVEYDLGFDVDFEPGDEDYPGIEKPDETVNVESGLTVIEDPKRPGYVFQGWTIPNAAGTEAIDQDLVYQDEADGKWYVDASKLPDYANDEGRVELTARWTSVISVDVPSAVTFYADVVTQGNESREGAASSAFGQNKVASQSEVDLRIVGLESTAVATEGTTLGADSILKKSDAATPSSSAQKLFSLYPTDKALTADDLQDPDAVSQAKPSDAVDFALDDLLLERSFAADAFTIPAGDTLNLGYRLNLAETGTELDYDTLSALDEGASASIANISYCFAADVLPSEWGEPLWIENPDQSLNPAKYLLLDDIKEAAEDLSANGESSAYYSMYKGMLDCQITYGGILGEGPYFHLKVNDVYLDLQLIGICQDTKTAGGKAGLTFQTAQIFAQADKASDAAGGFAFLTSMRNAATNASGWQSATLRTRLRSTFYGYLDPVLQSAIAPVNKTQQLPTSGLQSTTDETIWLPSMYEVFGTTFSGHNGNERGFQYMAYQGNNGSTTNLHANKRYNSGCVIWWFRSAYQGNTSSYCYINGAGLAAGSAAVANVPRGVAPAFCL